MSLKAGVCVKIPDGRIGRVRDYDKSKGWRVRVKRKTSDTHQFMFFKESQLKIIKCPGGWMSISGYNSYLRKTLDKQKSAKHESRIA